MGGDDVSRFVAKFPSDEQPLDSTDISDDYPRRRIFWTQQPPHQTTTSCSDIDADAVWKLQQKIKLAFCRVFTPRLNGLIQFWAPGVVDDPTALSTSRQPFSLEDLDNPLLVEYRVFSTNYCAVFRKPAFSMVLLDLKAIAHMGVSLVDKALDCGLTCLIWLPVFQVFGHPPPGSFVGVVECCFNPSGYDAIAQVLLRLILAIKSVCLTTYHVQQRLPHEPTLGINRAKVEIEEALKIVCESLHLSRAQVWIDHDTVNRCPSSPSSPFHNLEVVEEEDHSKPPEMFVVKFCGYLTRCEHPDNEYYVKLDYFDTCDVLPLLMDNGLPGKTLQTHDPRFCKDLSKLRVAHGLSGILCCRTRCSCLAICLRSTHTGKCVDYVFEFLWPRNRNQIILLESLLLTLKMCLPSFEFAAGAQLGDELRVLDVGNSTPGSETSSFKILQGNRFSQTPKASEEEG